ncbi:competence type IV pilus assembly protein ComGB (plasmid) [Bacillus sp. 31A1R]|uniref:Competence type IV pilus assembly protein ComGB n=1 Tax=Robertmurraya mangrovi TaxID=3098077 RepID=A0ABU5IV37_9BACI|nr:competence type IV pilus assembly protein ComGB [Bacillus sp. 31A1R]MDZ5471017.1 competence type IV pilus assembly protein ComGB [Bacillus sp. 31A1R]
MKRRNWTLQEQAYFLRKVGELLERGYPLAEAIDSIKYHIKKIRKEEMIKSLNKLKEGHPFHEILLELNFNKTLVGFVYFAEQHGGLALALKDGSDMMLKRRDDLQKLKQIIYYPLMLIFITFLLFLFIENVLLPRFSVLFQSMNLPQNFFTKLIYLFGTFLPIIFLLITLLFASSLSYYYFNFRKLCPIKQKTHISSIPVIGPFYRLICSHYFTVQLSYLLGGGLSVLEALNLFEKQEKQPFDQAIGREMKRKLSTGLKFEEIIQEYTFFEKELPLVIKHGQENGKLEQELFFFSKHCLSVFQNKTDSGLKIIQPILFSFIGILIVSMYLAILLPMFHMLKGM